MPPRPSSAALSASKIAKKERILQALNRMNDRDTQKAAAEDLASIVHHMDQEGLPIMLSCLCTTGSEHKVYARKECARALGIIASDYCPLREAALQAPHLGKVLGQLRKSLMDVDSGVREASAEALALVAQGLAQQAGAGGERVIVQAQGAPGGPGPSPVLKLLLECLGEQKKELNAAACQALGLSAPFLGTLEAPLAKELVRKLNSPAFQAPAALLGALARTDPLSGEPSGLIKSGPAAFVPILSALVGQPPAPQAGAPSPGSGSGSGTGAVGCLHRPDWQVRQAAADMLRATALLLGPLVEAEGGWADAKSVTARALKGLESCRFDKVRDVRDVARAALAVVEDLREYGTGGGSVAGWPEFIADRLRARGLPAPLTPEAAPPAPSPAPAPVPLGRISPLRRSRSPPRRPRSAVSPSPPPRRRSPTPERRPSPVFERAGSLSERFRAAHQALDVLVHDPLGRYQEPDQDQDRASVRSAAQSAAAAAAPLAAGPGLGEELRPEAAAGAGAGAGAPAAGSRALSRNGSRAESVASGRGPVEPQFSVRSRDEGLPPPAPLAPADDLGGSLGPPTFSRQPSAVARPAPEAPYPGPPPGLPRSDSAARRSNSTTPPLPAWACYASTPPPYAAPAAPYATPTPTPGSVPPAVFGPGATPPVYGGAPGPSPAAAAGLAPTITVQTDEWLALQSRLKALEAQQYQLVGLQAKVRSLEAALEASQTQLLSASPSAASVPPPLPYPPPIQVGPPSPHPLLSATDSEASWVNLNRTIRPGQVQPGPGSPLGGPGLGPGSATAAGRLAAYGFDNGGVVSPRVSLQLPSASPSVQASQDFSSGGGAGSGGGGGSGGGAMGDVRQLYREALAGGRQKELALLRLMSQTGPVWNDLGQEMCTHLLATFTSCLQAARADGPLLGRMMPWLWRLADDENSRFDAPPDMRAPLLAALRSAQLYVSDFALHEKMALLASTLRVHWALPESPSASRGVSMAGLAQAGAPPPPPYAAPPSSQPPSFGGALLAVQPPSPQGAGPDSLGAIHSTVSVTPEPVSPAALGDASGPGTPRSGVGGGGGRQPLSALAAPSLGTLMGMMGNLERDFAAAKASPARGGSRPGSVAGRG